jgi:hypothetical protein
MVKRNQVIFFEKGDDVIGFWYTLINLDPFGLDTTTC